VTQKPEAPARGPTAGWPFGGARLVLSVSCVVLLAAVIATSACTKSSIGASLGGQLNVLVRPPDRTIEPVPIEQQGALPVKSGGAMCLDAHLEQPAFVYLVWLDSEGQVLPLYPWNNERLEVMDADQTPPERRTTNLVFSPLLGHTWTFGNKPGPETVILLSRRTPLPADVKLASLIAHAKQEPSTPRSAKNDSPKSDVSDKAVTFIKMTRTRTDVSVIENGKPRTDIVTYTEDPLLSILMHLKPHFDLLHAVQFHHESTSSKPGEDSPSTNR
jgi:hypothetical protein